MLKIKTIQIDVNKNPFMTKGWKIELNLAISVRRVDGRFLKIIFKVVGKLSRGHMVPLAIINMNVNPITIAEILWLSFIIDEIKIPKLF